MAIRRLITTAIDSLSLPNTTSSTSNTTGALIVAGGAGIRGNLYATAVYAANYYYANSAPFVSGSSYTLPAATTSTLGGVIADGTTITVAANGRISASNTLPSQTGNSGKYLTTDGSVSSWSNVSALPSQSGNSGKYLTTDGTNSSWSNVTTLPTQTANSGKFLTTNGTTASWANVSVTPTAVSDQQNSSNGAFALPVGNTAQRPATAYNGYTRINSQTGYLEVYYNSTWNPLLGIGYLSATGGTITYDGNYKIHTFTSSGTFNVNSITPTSSSVEYLVVAGGGAGGGAGQSNAGGGGAGGFRTGTISVSAQSYSITVGAGGTGAGGNVRGENGSDSIFSAITSIGGGGGGTHNGPQAGKDGGSGGGGTQGGGAPGLGTAGQGNNGGGYVYAAGCGGGGAGGPGQTAPASSSAYAGSFGGYPISAFINGGPGLSSTITGTSVYYAGGGGGGQRDAYGVTPNGSGGIGGGGAGGTEAGLNGFPGTVNTGGGGGGVGGNGSETKVGGSGGSGIVVIRYRYQ